MYINKSLCFLEQVVLALADRRREHVPFRQSKLTACLKDSIGGNCNTRLVANVWAEAAQIEETVCTNSNTNTSGTGSGSGRSGRGCGRRLRRRTTTWDHHHHGIHRSSSSSS